MRRPTRRPVRWLLALVLAGTFVLPAAALAGPPQGPPGRRDCKRLTRQIAHYADVVDMARERNDETWERHTLAHIGRLSERRARLCPQYAERPAGEQLLQMLKNAARIASALYTWGLL